MFWIVNKKYYYLKKCLKCLILYNMQYINICLAVLKADKQTDQQKNLKFYVWDLNKNLLMLKYFECSFISLNTSLSNIWIIHLHKSYSSLRAVPILQLMLQLILMQYSPFNISFTLFLVILIKIKLFKLNQCLISNNATHVAGCSISVCITFKYFFC